MPLISVCICTFHRNELLEKLLNKLLQQKLADGVTYEIIVVDNDKSGLARQIVDPIIARNKHRRIVYDIEPNQNIALARNRTVKHAQGDFIAFIDDDEYPSPHWLQELYKTHVSTNADAVMGPVFPEYPEHSPEWIINGRFFEKPNHEDQVRVKKGRTSNALVKSSWFNSLMFDEIFGLTGGEDSDFFNRLKQKGGVICWSKAAFVTERVDKNRMNIKWLLARSFRGGQGTAGKKYSSFFKLAYLPHLVYRLLLLIVAFCGTVCSLPFGRHRVVWFLMKVSSSAGQISAVFPYRYKEYRK